MDPIFFAKLLAQNGFSLSEKQLNQFKIYYQELVNANKYTNLTRITSESDVYLKHFYDSLTPLLYFKDIFTNVKTLCDVGAGAGFPSLPIKIIMPKLQVTIVDSLGKRLNFLKDLTAKLGVDDVNLVHGRAEDVGQNLNYREKFDLVTARAVAQMPTLSEYCLPLVRQDGHFFALKGPKARQELEVAKKAITTLGGQIDDIKELELPESDEIRTLILITKVKPTPKKYPRQAGTPKRQPIE